MKTFASMGQIVTLNSGGPAMTITEVPTGDNAPAAVRVKWFNGTVLESEVFMTDCLTEKEQTK